MTIPATDSTATRITTATILRAVADLIETRPDLPEPDCRVSFYVHGGDDTAATMAAIAAALPCGWHARIKRSGQHEWMDLDSDTPGASVLRGTQVHISAPASAVCIPAGAKSVTVWQPVPALTGLAGALPLAEVA